MLAESIAELFGVADVDPLATGEDPIVVGCALLRHEVEEAQVDEWLGDEHVADARRLPSFLTVQIIRSGSVLSSCGTHVRRW